MITTNNHIRDFLDIYDVPSSEIDEYNEDSSSWVKYKNMYIPLCDFMSLDNSEWSGVFGLTNTASIVIKLLDDDQYIIGLAT